MAGVRALVGAGMGEPMHNQLRHAAAAFTPSDAVPALPVGHGVGVGPVIGVGDQGPQPVAPGLQQHQVGGPRGVKRPPDRRQVFAGCDMAGAWGPGSPTRGSRQMAPQRTMASRPNCCSAWLGEFGSSSQVSPPPADSTPTTRFVPACGTAQGVGEEDLHPEMQGSTAAPMTACRAYGALFAPAALCLRNLLILTLEDEATPAAARLHGALGGKCHVEATAKA